MFSYGPAVVRLDYTHNIHVHSTLVDLSTMPHINVKRLDGVEAIKDQRPLWSWLTATIIIDIINISPPLLQA